MSARVCMYMRTRAGTPTCAESCVHAQLGVHTRVQRQHRRAWAEGVAQRAGWTLGRFREALEGQVASPWPHGTPPTFAESVEGKGVRPEGDRRELRPGRPPRGEAVTEIAPGGLTERLLCAEAWVALHKCLSLHSHIPRGSGPRHPRSTAADREAREVG